jgi:hypothetical protein
MNQLAHRALGQIRTRVHRPKTRSHKLSRHACVADPRSPAATKLRLLRLTATNPRQRRPRTSHRSTRRSRGCVSSSSSSWSMYAAVAPCLAQPAGATTASLITATCGRKFAFRQRHPELIPITFSNLLALGNLKEGMAATKRRRMRGYRGRIVPRPRGWARAMNSVCA